MWLFHSQKSIKFSRYESEFFQNVVNGRDIVSWGAVDRNHPNGESDEIIGFVTARLVLANESEVSLLNNMTCFQHFKSIVLILKHYQSVKHVLTYHKLYPN